MIHYKTIYKIPNTSGFLRTYKINKNIRQNLYNKVIKFIKENTTIYSCKITRMTCPECGDSFTVNKAISYMDGREIFSNFKNKFMAHVVRQIKNGDKEHMKLFLDIFGNSITKQFFNKVIEKNQNSIKNLKDFIKKELH